MDCIPKIPAWIMPLHRLWETVDAEPGLFDTIIIDEASQAGIDSLALLLLAKRIIVVGDDKQNSPEAVGVLEDDISRLARSKAEERLDKYLLHHFPMLESVPSEPPHTDGHPVLVALDKPRVRVPGAAERVANVPKVVREMSG